MRRVAWVLAFSGACATPDAPAWFDPDPVAPVADPAASPAPALVLNEVMTDNESVVMTPALAFADWVELYNAGDADIDLSRATLAEDEGGTSWVGRDTLAPGQRRLLWATGEVGPYTLPFALDADGDTLVLAWDGVPIDRIATGPLPVDTAWARFPDGGAWAVTARPTPGAPNGAAPSDTLDPTDAIFDPTVVHALDLLISDEGLRSLDASPYTQVEASLGFQGAWFPRVGVAAKGVYGSLRATSGKIALKLDLNDYESHHLRGLEHLTLNNMVQDPSAVHEVITYAWLRERGIPAPRTGWVRLTINGEDRGFYLLVETTDEHMLARWFDDATGQLWEGAYGVDLEESELSAFEYDSGPDVPDYTALAAVTAILDGAPTDAAVAELETWVDLDQLLAVLAFEAVSYHWDGYTTANNYRLYEDPGSGRIHMMPWGLDQTWVNAYYGPWDGQGRMFRFCIANAGCRARYDQALLDWADAVATSDLEGDVAAVLPLVRAQLATDPYFEADMPTQRGWTDATLDTLRTWPAQVRAAAEADLAAL